MVKKNKKQQSEKQIKIFIGLMAVLLIIILAISLITSSGNTFKYKGLEFKKVREGELIFYDTSFPLFNQNKEIVKYIPFSFRNDPRELENIPVEDNLKLTMKTAIASNREDIEGCKNSVVSGATLALFLNRLGIETVGGTTNKTQAQEDNREYLDNQTEIVILRYKAGNETRIYNENENKTILSHNNCEILDATERYILGLYEQSIS